MIRKLSLIILLVLLTITVGYADQYINKETVSVQGKADPFVEVKIFNNNKQIMKVNSNEDGMWLATDIPVKEGRNEIYAKAFDQFGNESKFSKRINVVVDTDPPKILKFEIDKDRYKAGEDIKMKVIASEDTESAIVVMPDGSMLDLKKVGNKEFEGEWEVDESIAEGKYRLSLSITDRAGNMAQEYSRYLRIVNALGELEISSPSNNTIVYQTAVTITGFAGEATDVAVNNKNKTEVAKDGNFSVEFQGLLPGKNQLRVTAFHGSKSIYKDLNIIRLLTFPDIQQHPFRTAIEYLATLGRMQAYANTQFFKPQMPMSRAEVIATLVQDLAAGYQVLDTGSGGFVDIPGNYWAGDDIMIAAQNQLIIGYPDKSFKPKRTITRAELATLMVRYAHIPLIDTIQIPHQDVKPNSWAKNYIGTFISAGLMPPTWQGSYFHPDRPVSRAEFSYILARVPLIKKQIEALIGIPVEFSSYSNTDYYQYANSAGNQIPIGSPADGLTELQRAQMYQQVDPVPIRQQTAVSVYNKPPPSPPPQTGRQIRQTDQPATQQMNAPRSIYSVEVFPKSLAAGDELNVILFLIENIESASIKGINQEKVIFKKSSNHKYNAVYRIPEDTDSGSYFVDIVVEESGGRMASLRSESFVVRSLKAAPTRKVEKQVEQTTVEIKKKAEPVALVVPEKQSGVIYPEEFNDQSQQTTAYNVTKVKSSATDGQPSYTASGYLTRARMAEVLGNNNYLRKAVVNGPVADDVPERHPQAKFIKTAIITEKIPNLKPGKFKPADPVSRAYAAVVLCKTADLEVRLAIEPPADDVARDHWAADQIYTLKLLEIITDQDFRPAAKISEKEFSDWIKKVKKL